MDNRRFNGGNKNAGRKPKAIEEQTNTVFLNALKRIYDEDAAMDAKISFVIGLHESERGKLFIAQHLFGKAPDKIELNEVNPKHLEITLHEARIINKALEEEY